MNNKAIISWLLEGDVSIQYQVYRDLLSEDRADLRAKISTQGWGKKFLSKRNKNGHWGLKYYQPKWTSSHYTLLDLRYLNIDPDIRLVQETIELILSKEKAGKGDYGGLLPIGKNQICDVCLNGMFLNFASYFQTNAEDLNIILDFIITQHMPDGGFNCRLNRSGARHSSLHSTLSVLEGISTYEKSGYTYRLKDLIPIKKACLEFILLHQLYLSDRTGDIIHPNFIRLSYPGRWRYDILKALDYFQYANIPWDPRMQAAIDVLLKKRNKDGTWSVQAKHPGQVHFDMEKAGKPSRWNTLRALRVLKHFGL